MLVLTIALAATLAMAEAFLRYLSPSREVGPSFTVFDENYGKRLKPNARLVRWTPEFEMSMSVNALGFRGPDVSTQAEVLLFLGDSFTMGYGVNDGQEFPAIVRSILQARGAKIEVVNAGIGDNGNGRSVRFLRRDAPVFRVRAVVLQVHDNDFGDNLRERSFELGPGGQLVELPVGGPSTARQVNEWMERAAPFALRLHLVSRVRQLLAHQAGAATPARTTAPAEAGPEVDLTVRLVAESIAICREHGWPVLALLVDLRPQYQRVLEELLRRNGVPFRTSARRSDRPDLYYRVDGHWNREGHEAAAVLALELLEESGVLRRRALPAAR